MNAKRWLWRRAQHWVLGSCDDGELHVERALPVSASEHTVLDEENDRVLAWTSEQVRELRGLREEEPVERNLFSAEPGAAVRCVFLLEGVLFLGGSSAEGPLLVWCELDAEEPSWIALEKPTLPSNVNPRKPIDAFLHDGSRLYALDDLFPPRWLFAYEVSNPRAVKLLGFAELPARNPVRSAVLGERWLALLIDGFSHGVLYTSIAFVARETLDRCPLDGEELSAFCQLSAPHKRYEFRDQVCLDGVAIAADGDDLWLAASTDGVAVLKLEPQQFEPFREESYGTLGTRGAWRRFAWIATPEGDAQHVRAISPGMVLAECLSKEGVWTAVLVHDRPRLPWPAALLDPEASKNPS